MHLIPSYSHYHPSPCSLSSYTLTDFGVYCGCCASNFWSYAYRPGITRFPLTRTGYNVIDKQVNFLTFCWPCISVYLSQYLTNFKHKICFTISFISCLYMFRAPCAHHQEVKIALHSLWYHHTYRCDDTRYCVMQFWPPDDEHMVLETCRGMK